MPNIGQFKNNEERNEWYREYRKKNREKLRKYNREYNKEWRHKNGYESERRWKKQNPEKTKAQRLAQYALRIGQIKRQNCKICNKRKAEMHHEDYAKPLDVIFLCKLHHVHAHINQTIDKI